MRTPDKLTQTQSIELIEELQLNEPAEISKVRARDSVKLRARIHLQHGNASQRDGRRIESQTREISREHLQITTAAPVAVGDIYLVEFDREQLHLPDAYLQCISCRELASDRFDAEMRFFVPVDLSRIPRSDES